VSAATGKSPDARPDGRRSRPKPARQSVRTPELPERVRRENPGKKALKSRRTPAPAQPAPPPVALPQGLQQAPRRKASRLGAGPAALRAAACELPQRAEENPPGQSPRRLRCGSPLCCSLRPQDLDVGRRTLGRRRPPPLAKSPSVWPVVVSFFSFSHLLKGLFRWFVGFKK